MVTAFLVPAPEYSILVRRYEHIRIESCSVNIEDHHIPDGSAAFVFNLAGDFFTGYPDKIPLPPFFIAPPQKFAVQISAQGNHLESFIAICNASVLSKVVGIHFNNHKSSYFVPLNPEVYHYLFCSLQNHNRPEERVAIFEDFLDSKLNFRDYIKDEIDHIYEQILYYHGIIPISLMNDIANMNPRTFRRKFSKRVGIGVKSLAGLVRIRFLWDRLQTGQKTSIQDMVFEGSYFDQAHFINDFKKVTGESPGHFFKREHVNTKIMSGKQ